MLAMSEAEKNLYNFVEAFVSASVVCPAHAKCWMATLGAACIVLRRLVLAQAVEEGS